MRSFYFFLFLFLLLEGALTLYSAPGWVIIAAACFAANNALWLLVIATIQAAHSRAMASQERIAGRGIDAVKEVAITGIKAQAIIRVSEIGLRRALESGGAQLLLPDGRAGRVEIIDS